MKTKTIVAYALTILLIILVGYIYREEFFFFCIGDTYYVVTYLTLAIYLSELLGLIFLMRYIVKRIRLAKAQ